MRLTKSQFFYHCQSWVGLEPLHMVELSTGTLVLRSGDVTVAEVYSTHAPPRKAVGLIARALARYNVWLTEYYHTHTVTIRMEHPARYYMRPLCWVLGPYREGHISSWLATGVFGVKYTVVQHPNQAWSWAVTWPNCDPQPSPRDYVNSHAAMRAAEEQYQARLRLGLVGLKANEAPPPVPAIRELDIEPVEKGPQ